jgi:O-antigen/teichoic acid export membrane protein
VIRNLFNKAFKGHFAKSFAIIAGGTAFAQGMSIALSPVLTRIYTPEQYGVLTVYTATLTLLAISASLDYQKAIPIADDDDKALNLLALSMIVLFGFVSLVTLLIIFKGENILRLLKSESLLNYKFLIPIGVLFTGTYNVLLQWSFRKRAYKIITKTKVSQSLFANIVKIGLGLLRIGSVGLIFGAIVGQSAGLTTLAKPILKEKNLLKNISFTKIKSMAKRYIKFPIYTAPSHYAYTAGSQLPVVFLTALYGSLVIGLFGLANSIVNLPVGLIGMSVAQVFYAEAANIGKNNPKKTKDLASKLIKKLALVGLGPVLILVLFGPWLFSFVFGPNWYEAGVYARTLSIMVYFHFIILPIGRILEIFERQREGLLLNIFRLILILIVFWIVKHFSLSSYQAVALYTATVSFTYILLLFAVQYILNNEIRNKETRNQETK